MKKQQWLNINGSIEIFNTTEKEFMSQFFAWLEEREFSFVGTTELENEDATKNLPSAIAYLVQENQMRVEYESFLKDTWKASKGKVNISHYSYEMFCEIFKLGAK